MCNLYHAPTPDHVADFFGASRKEWGEYAAVIAPRKPGPFFAGGKVRVGSWGLIPPYSKSRVPLLPNGRPLSTNNARRERMTTAPTYRDAWKRGQRCLIPAISYDEPYWGASWFPSRS